MAHPIARQMKTAGESATDNGISDSDSYSSELEQYQQLKNEITAVFEYLQNEGQFTDAELSFDANAKGETYGLISAGQEQAGTRMVDVEYRLYINFNGEKTNDEGEKPVQKSYWKNFIRVEATVRNW